MGSQEHPHLDGEPTPAVPPPQDPAGDSLEPEGLEQMHRRIVVSRHGRKDAVGSARPEEPERLLNERPSRAESARPGVHGDEVHVPDRRRATEEDSFEEALDRRSIPGHEERPGVARSAERKERVQTIERSPSDPHNGRAVGEGRLTNPHGSRYRPRPKNVPVSAPRCPVPSPGGSRGGPRSTGRGGRNNSRRSNVASICSRADRTPRGPSPAARVDSPSNRSGSTRGAADTSGSCGPFHYDRGRRIRRDAGEGSVKVHAGGSEPGDPRMSRVARLQRILQPAARLVLQSGKDEIEIVR